MAAATPFGVQGAMDFTANGYCPCCVSLVLIMGSGTQRFTCEVCGTEFTVEVDPEKFAEHSMT